MAFKWLVRLRGFVGYQGEHPDYFKRERCPEYQGSFSDHERLQVALVSVKSQKIEKQKFVRAIDREDWQTVVNFQEFDALEDTYICHIVVCASKPIYYLLIIKDHCDLDYNDSLIDTKDLTMQNFSELKSAFQAVR